MNWKSSGICEQTTKQKCVHCLKREGVKEAPEDKGMRWLVLHNIAASKWFWDVVEGYLGSHPYLSLPAVKPRLKNGQSSYDKSSLTDNHRITHQNDSEEISRFKMEA